MDHLDAARSVLEEGRHLYVAVVTPAGPHVTPELYAVAGGRVWFWSAADTLKVKSLRRDPRASAIVSVDGRSVLLTGSVEQFDPRDVKALPRALRDPIALGRATMRFGLRNAADLSAFAGDLARGRLGRSLPPRRVLLGVTPSRSAIVDNGRVLHALGHWPMTGSCDGAAPPTGLRAGVLAWEIPDGCVALPARIDLAAHEAWVAPSLVTLAGLPSRARVAAVVDDYVAPGPAAKEGTLLRGTATVDGGHVTIELERRTEWKGVATKTVTSRSA
jgi:hypothetical protein